MELKLENIREFSIQDYLNREFDCSCGRKHSVSISDIIVESNAIYRLTDLIQKYGYKNIFMVADRNTFEAAGNLVEKEITGKGFNFSKYLFDGNGELVPDERALGRLFIEINKETDIIVAVGSGTVNDLCRCLSHKLGLPYLIVATAPSMDGYASNVSPLIVNNLKVTFPAACPKAIIADVDIMKKAPMPMILAGLGDILGKYTSLCDWRLGNIVNGEYHCSTIESMVFEALGKCMADIEGIKRRENSAIKNLAEGLILSGIAMSFAGNSRPASGAEHHLSHFWEMMFLFDGKPAVLHGLKVGITTTASAKIYSILSKMNVDFEKAFEAADKYDKEKWIEYVGRVYREGAGDVVKQLILDNSDLEYNRKKRIVSIRENWNEIVGVINKYVPNADNLRETLAACGAPARPSDVGVEENTVFESLLAAKELRPRYTILQLAADLALLDQAAAEAKEYLINN